MCSIPTSVRYRWCLCWQERWSMLSSTNFYIDNFSHLHAPQREWDWPIGYAIFRAVVISRLTYASPVWLAGSSRISQPQQAMRLLPTCHARFWSAVGRGRQSTVWEKLNNPHYTLYQQLPPQSAASQKYNLRCRNHDRQQEHPSDCNFITRLQYNNIHCVLQTIVFIV